jgi:hypothetical protein
MNIVFLNYFFFVSASEESRDDLALRLRLDTSAVLAVLLATSSLFETSEFLAHSRVIRWARTGAEPLSDFPKWFIA